MNKEKLKDIARWVGIVIAVVMAAFALLGAPIKLPGQNAEIDAQGIRYGQYGNAWFHGSVIVDNDLAVTDDFTISGNSSAPYSVVTVPTAQATATPGLYVNNYAADGNSILVSARTTPVAYIDKDGNVTAQNVTGVNASVSNVAVAVPTAQATATPAIYVNNISADGNSLVVAKAATPVAYIDKDGNITGVAGTLSGALNMSNQVISNIGNAGTDFDANGGLALAGNITVTGNTSLSALLVLGFANQAVSDGETITPTDTVIALDTSGAVTITLGAVGSEGQLLVLINDDANTVIINDANIRTSDGDVVTMAGAYDVTVWIYQDNEWLLLLAIANS